MSFIEFVGFIISFSAMIFLVIKRVFEERQRRLNPEEYARKERIKEQNLRRFMKSRDIYSGDREEDVDEYEDEEEEEELRPVVKKWVNKPPSAPPAITHQQAFIKLRDAQKLQATQQKKSPVAQQGNYGSETASDKKRSLAATDAGHSMHHDLKPADSYEVIRIERVTVGS
ncbi:MAG TPA: hypothetical protein VGP47_00700, partial [Parachlamydiaceae bacterium]|nr:hypothetical protein [Parachlamydiaceae bacterium]